MKRFPIDNLKIDKSFIAKVTTDTHCEVIVNILIVMMHSLGLKVIAEAGGLSCLGFPLLTTRSAGAEYSE
ncbi:EAL domain-containing protein [Pseudohongiella acticola]|uniref:EAL domain-containing protein n=1 Tax=Pseudohongiella acticola TaxID=1524254 RepID=UPI000ACB61DA